MEPYDDRANLTACIADMKSSLISEFLYAVGSNLHKASLERPVEEIASLPGPDRTISDEDIRNCRMISRRYRNRRIGDFLKELQLVEGRNTGIPTILRAMAGNGSPSPVFETDEERTYLTVILPVHEGFLVSTDAKQQEKERQEKKGSGVLEGIKTKILNTLERPETPERVLHTAARRR